MLNYLQQACQKKSRLTKVDGILKFYSNNVINPVFGIQ